MLQHVPWRTYKGLVPITQAASVAATSLIRQLHVLQPCVAHASSGISDAGSSHSGVSILPTSSININVNAATVPACADQIQVHLPQLQQQQQQSPAKQLSAQVAANMHNRHGHYASMLTVRHGSSSLGKTMANTSRCRSVPGGLSSRVHSNSICGSSSGGGDDDGGGCGIIVSTLGSSCRNRSSHISSAVYEASSIFADSGIRACSSSDRLLGSITAGSSTFRIQQCGADHSPGSNSSWGGSSLHGSLGSTLNRRSEGLLLGTTYSSNSSSTAFGSMCISRHSITCKPHHGPRGVAADEQLEEQGALSAAQQQHLARLRLILEEAGLSFPARMSVLQQNYRRPLNPDTLPSRLKQLQDIFGRSQTNAMLTSAAYLLESTPQRLKLHYDGLVTLLAAGDKYVDDLIRRSPDLLNHNPALVQRKLQLLQDMLQIDHKSLLRLVKKAPTIIKMQSSKVQAQLDFFAAAGDLAPRDMFKVFTSWPVMASTSLTLLKARYRALSELLHADSDDMKRICRSFTSLLGRDPNQLDSNITTLAAKLGIPKEQVLHFARKEPGLLSWNVTNLVNRVMTVSQMLRLPQDKALTLLSYNRPLLTNIQELPHKLELLQRVLGVPESELYPLVHRYLPVMRFPVNAAEAKLACIGSLVHLHPPWQQEWPKCTPLSKVRMIQAGWSCHWRLVYLLQSGQQHSSTPMVALRMPHAKFQRLYPDYPHWLNRYNQAVHGHNIPVVDAALLGSGSSGSRCAALEGPACYEAVLLDSMQGAGWGVGSLFIRDKDAALERQSMLISLTGSRSSGSGDDTPTGTQVSAAEASACLPCTPAGRLAAWLGIDIAHAQQLSAVPAVHKLPWAAWRAKFSAAANLLDSLVTGCKEQANTGGDTQHPHTTLPPCMASGQPGVIRSRRQLRRASSETVAAAAAAVGDAGEDSSSSCSRRRRQNAVHSEAAVCVTQYDSLSLCTGQQQQQQEIAPQFAQLAEQMVQHASAQQQHGIDQQMHPPPAAQVALAHALASGQSRAVAAVAVAAFVAPFSRQLYLTPPRPPDAVVQFVVQHPEAFVREPFENVCNALAALAKASPYACKQLSSCTPSALAAYVACHQTKLRYVQYLVDTQQPMPWAYTLRALLVGSSWYTCNGIPGIKEEFTAVYPGYKQWEQAMQKL